MCFSAEASFTAALCTGLVGVACLTQVRRWREAPLAAMPLVFSLQQGFEGVIWRGLTGPSSLLSASASLAVAGFLAVALVIWPLYAPVAALLVEPGPRRRMLMTACLGLGGVSALCLARYVSLEPHTAHLAAAHICYAIPLPHRTATILVYVCATGLPLIISSFRWVAGVGAAILTGSAVSALFYFASFPSVWCFFAAAASMGVLLHFGELRARHALLPAASAAPAP